MIIYGAWLRRLLLLRLPRDVQFESQTEADETIQDVRLEDMED